MVLIFTLGWITRGIWGDYKKTSPPVREIRQNGYSFTNPLLECDIAADAISDRDVFISKSKIESFILSKTNDYKLAHVSVYFRDLNNGPWMGINEEEKFAPSSLVKVPLMMAWLKQAENNPQLLSKKIEYKKGDADYNYSQNIKPFKTIMPGHAYSAEELIYAMIAYSDNNAYILLLKNVDPNVSKKVYNDLELKVPIISKTHDIMTVKEYASFFRILFNASYLSREMSEKALQYLSEAEFRDGIVAGVPSDVAVSHKFGERSLGAQNEIKELHDCGIIYYPKNPYLLCIMTRGTDFSALDDIIKDISYLIYNDTDHHYKNK